MLSGASARKPQWLSTIWQLWLESFADFITHLRGSVLVVDCTPSGLLAGAPLDVCGLPHSLGASRELGFLHCASGKYECARRQDEAALPFMASSQVLQPRFSLCPTRHRQVSEIGPDSKEGDVYLLWHHDNPEVIICLVAECHLTDHLTVSKGSIQIYSGGIRWILR